MKVSAKANATKKTRQDKAAALLKREGALILPTANGLGHEIVPFSSLQDVITGEDAIVKALGEKAEGANVMFTDASYQPRLLQMDADLFYRAYASARNGRIVNCKPHCRAVVIDTPEEDMTGNIGKYINGQGIYIGVWEPTNQSGNSMGKAFDVYTAPTIIRKGDSNEPLAMTFNDASFYVSQLKNWHGFNGSTIKNHTDIIRYISYSEYSQLRKWFIPTRELVWGKNHKDQQSFATPMIDIQNFGALHGTFDTEEPYWSCTLAGTKKDVVHGVNFAKGNSGNDPVNEHKFFTRPVRAVLRR